MADSFWLSPAFLASAAFTAGLGCYSYVYLPIQMRRAYRQGLLTLARAVETKDTGSEGHGERVAAYVVAVAKEMGVPAKERLKMEYAAFLEDIGNVRVPHAILNKTSRLTKGEFDILKAHSVIGADMVEQVTFLRDIAPIIRHHHEAWDGSGYPDKISGRDIPLGARIVAVCTAYDSMVHARAYRARMTEERAIQEVRAGAGTKYDPAVIDVFLRVLRKRHITEEPPS